VGRAAVRLGHGAADVRREQDDEQRVGIGETEPNRT
jgi:hypothetical protein